MCKTFQFFFRCNRNNTINKTIAFFNGQPIVTNEIISSNSEIENRKSKKKIKNQNELFASLKIHHVDHIQKPRCFAFVTGIVVPNSKIKKWTQRHFDTHDEISNTSRWKFLLKTKNKNKFYWITIDVCFSTT